MYVLMKMPIRSCANGSHMVPGNSLRFASRARGKEHIDRRRCVGMEHVAKALVATKRVPRQVPCLQRKIGRCYVVGQHTWQSSTRRAYIKRNFLLASLYETARKYHLGVAYSQP